MAEVGDMISVKWGQRKKKLPVVATAERGVYARDDRKRLLFFSHGEYDVV